MVRPIQTVDVNVLHTYPPAKLRLDPGRKSWVGRLGFLQKLPHFLGSMLIIPARVNMTTSFAFVICERLTKP